jgi:hypothetical protein
MSHSRLSSSCFLLRSDISNRRRDKRLPRLTLQCPIHHIRTSLGVRLLAYITTLDACLSAEAVLRTPLPMPAHSLLDRQVNHADPTVRDWRRRLQQHLRPSSCQSFSKTPCLPSPDANLAAPCMPSFRSASIPPSNSYCIAALNDAAL